MLQKQRKWVTIVTCFSLLMKIAGYSLAFAKLQSLYLSSMVKKLPRVTIEGERVRQS